MSESMANATYRAFNFPHHVTTYLSLYYSARNTELKTYRSWDWYLMRAANTTLKFGAPSVGVMVKIQRLLEKLSNWVICVG